MAAVEISVATAGATAGVEEYGTDRLLDELAADLKDGSYRPLAARRVFIPKPGKPTEQRALSIDGP